MVTHTAQSAVCFAPGIGTLGVCFVCVLFNETFVLQFSLRLRLFIRFGNQYARSMNCGQWSPDFLSALEQMVARTGGDSSPVAVFDADGTLWDTDANENFLSHLDTYGLVRTDGEQSIRQEYDRRCAQDKHAGYQWGAQVCDERPAEQVSEWAQQSYEERTAPFVFDAMRALVTRLVGLQWGVYVVSASPVWTVLPGTNALGIAPENVLALDVERQNGRLTRHLCEPLSMGEGKVACIQKYVGQAPSFAAGNTLDDVPMLRMAETMGVVVNPTGEDGDVSSLLGMAIKNGWHILRTRTMQNEETP